MDLVDWARAGAGLVVTLALIGLAALVARRLGMLQPQAVGKPRRMAVVETLFLDPRRKLVLVRVDQTEHVVLLSPFGDRPIDAGSPAIDSPSPTEPAP